MYLGAGISPDDCRARGGIPRVFYAHYDQWGRGIESTAVYSCDFPPAPVPAPASSPITVTTVVPTTTEVSPQVSPQFIQQQQPEDSPIGAQITGPVKEDSPIGVSRFNEPEAIEQSQQGMLELFRQMAAERQSPQAVYIPPTPSTPEPFVPSGEKEIPSPGPFNIPTEYIVAAAILGAALIGARAMKKGKPNVR